MTKLLAEIKAWLTTGEQLIILGDFNDDTAQPGFKQRFTKVGLVDALATLHGQPTWPTYNRWSFLIDAIYLSPALLQGATGGYLAFEEGLLSDHRGIWLDLHMEVLFGSHEQYHKPWAAWRLKCEDLRVVAKYNQFLLAAIWQQGLLEEINRLDKWGHWVPWVEVN